MAFTLPFSRIHKYSGSAVDLVIEHAIPFFGNSDDVRSLNFDIYLHDTGIRAGLCDLRLGMNEELYYAGNIGYRIFPGERGHGYAYEACRILFDIARSRGMTELIITCSPDNIPSRRTLEKLGGTLLETANVPEDHWLYQRGEKVKNIYRYDLLAPDSPSAETF